MLKVMKSHSFAPIGAHKPRVLILGSLPGKASLEANQYYAHPRNAFWPIVCDVFEFDSKLAYPDRIEALAQRDVALWDVVQSAVRPGSLDSAMRPETISTNDLTHLITQKQLRVIALNGAAAAKLFRKQALTTHAAVLELPSTSPAHAMMSLAHKLQAWRKLGSYL
jgi:double-stranded uracil-DNA glycosylase